jgi:hypothetical protein
VILLECAFEAFEQGEGVGRTASEAGEHATVVQPAHLARIAFHDGIPERNLAVAPQRFAQIQRGEILNCQSCQRFLYTKASLDD